MKQTAAELRSVKQALHEFAFSRSDASGDQLEREFGDLLLYLLRLADRLQIDPFLAAHRQIPQPQSEPEGFHDAAVHPAIR
jgi:NTP pyrophosphatase (non-canonical NTP hydrolase)